MLKRDRIMTLVALFVLSFIIVTAGGESIAQGRTPIQSTAENSPMEKMVSEETETKPLYAEGLIQALEGANADTALMEKWITRFPESALRYLPSWEPEKQARTGLLAAYILRENKRLEPRTAWREAAAFIHYGAKYGVPVDLVVAVANTESHFKPTARSSYGASGIMQVVWRIHANLMQANGILSEEELSDPEKGIAAGALLLSRYLRAYGTRTKALGRYYGGPAHVYMSRINKKLDRIRQFSEHAL
jgi:soluble lytic murein transglycosylase-like protein